MVYYSGQLHLISQTACSAYLHSRALKKGFVVMQPVEPVPKIRCDCPAWERGVIHMFCSGIMWCLKAASAVFEGHQATKSASADYPPSDLSELLEIWLLPSLFHGYLHLLSDSSLFGSHQNQKDTRKMERVQDGTAWTRENRSFLNHVLLLAHFSRFSPWQEYCNMLYIL